MQNMNELKELAIRNGSRALLVGKKYAPEILLGVGLIGSVVAAVLAAKASMKLKDVVIEHEMKIDDITDAYLVAQKAAPLTPEGERQHAVKLTREYINYGLDLTKLYGPAISLGVFSTFSILASNGIMKNRQVALIGAYKLMEEGFNAYRRRVTEELGSDADDKFRYGYETEEVKSTVIGPDGKKEKIKETLIRYPLDASGISIYAKLFDEYNVHWKPQPETNRFFLKAMQNYANDMLHARGHVFLNEVYESLGIPHSREGSIVGWIANSERGDRYIDFGLGNKCAERFAAGLDPNVMLDFNVDGVIWNLI
jgi:hypothetical protein